MDNLVELNQNELELISGGTFAWDAGWLLGNIVSGNFGTTAGQMYAVATYYAHY